MYLILLGAVLVIGFISSYYLLKPFRNTLEAIKNFSLRESKKNKRFPQSNIPEFKKLNHFLEEMTLKVSNDYQLLKEFSDNASHELQKPIAIIQGKLDVLLDSNKLEEDHVNQIISIQNTLGRLSSLSKSLSVLTKIENREFDSISIIDLSDEIEKTIGELRELMDLKSINLTTEIIDNVQIKVDRVLFELVLTNLINNAIRHNWKDGNIHIQLKKDSLEITNSGEDLEVEPSVLFQRFKKSNQSSNSLGLGLAIVKKICDYYSYTLEYSQNNEQHTIKIGWSS
jgi:signal transduction histidine kinase